MNGTSPDYFAIRDWSAVKGSLFAQSDVDGQTKTAVLGQTVVGKLFSPTFNPLGQTIRINNVPFIVIGVLKAKGQSMQGQDSDDVVFVPETTFQSKIQGGLQKYVNGSITRRRFMNLERAHLVCVIAPPSYSVWCRRRFQRS